MKKLLLSLLLLCGSVRSATPTTPITGGWVDPLGWIAWIQVSNVGTNSATFNFAYGTNGVPSANTPYWSCISQGYNDDGTTNQITWGGYLCPVPMRLAYPNATTNAIVANSGNIQIPIALAKEFIFQKDIAVTLTFPADGWFSQGGTNTAATTITLTNLSTLAYPPCIVNWSEPGRQRIYGPTWTNSVVGFHQSGIMGRPLRAVRFYGQDTSGNQISPVFVTSPTVNKALGDACDVQEYTAILSTNGLANLVQVTNHFTAWPWRGDTNSVVDTLTGHYIYGTNTVDTVPGLRPQIWWTTFGSTYGTLVAVVDSASTNTHGGITNFNLFTPGVTALKPFDTIDHALLDIKTSNGTYFSHLDTAGSIIYLTNCSAAFTGGSSAYGTNGMCWTTLAGYPGVDRSLCILNTQSGGKAMGGTDKYENLTVTISGAVSIWTGSTYAWFNSNYFDIPTGGTSWAFHNTVWHVTRNTFNRLWIQGMAPPSLSNFPLVICRGNDLSGCTNVGTGLQAYMVLGNKKTTPYGFVGTQLTVASQASPPLDNVVIAYNKFYGYNGVATMCSFASKTNNGVAFVQNVFEGLTNFNQTISGWFADDSTGSTFCSTNTIFWYNTMLGNRVNMLYNNTVGANPNRVLASVKNNYFDVLAVKTDTFASAQATANTNNWSDMWGVGFSGNVFAEITGIAAAGNFMLEFPGVNSYQPRSASESNTQITGTPNTTNAFPFFNEQRWNGTVTSTTGNGDYHFKSEAFAVRVNSLNAANMQPWWGLPFDANGDCRDGWDYAGAFVGKGKIQSGGGFFAN